MRTCTCALRVLLKRRLPSVFLFAGGYWATPHHHVLPFLAQHDRGMACRLLNATIASFRGHGIWEWVGPFWPSKQKGAAGYIASAAGTYFASKQLRCWQ